MPNVIDRVPPSKKTAFAERSSLKKAVAGVIVAVMMPLAGVPAWAADVCRRYTIDSEANLSSIFSVVQRGRSSDLLITDPMNMQAVVLSPSGKLVSRRIEDKSTGPLLAISKVGSEHMEFFLSQVRRSDENMNARSRLDLSINRPTSQVDEVGASRKLLSLYDWTVAVDHLVGYGAVEGSLTFELGFFKHKIQEFGSGQPTETHLIEPFRPAHVFYKIGHQSFTSQGHIVYYLRMGIYPELYEYDARSDAPPRRLWNLPGENMRLPVLPGAPRNSVFRAVEQATMPAGIFSQGDLLFVLYRVSDESGISWIMAELKPSYDDVEFHGFVQFPIDPSTQHVSVLPTPTSWIVFPKGRAVGKKQQVDTMLVIPRNWISPKNSPLRVEVSEDLMVGRSSGVKCLTGD